MNLQFGPIWNWINTQFTATDKTGVSMSRPDFRIRGSAAVGPVFLPMLLVVMHFPLLAGPAS